MYNEYNHVRKFIYFYIIRNFLQHFKLAILSDIQHNIKFKNKI